MLILCSGILVTPEFHLPANTCSGMYTRICRATPENTHSQQPMASAGCELPIIMAGPLTSFLLLCCLWNYGYSKGSCRQRLSLSLGMDLPHASGCSRNVCSAKRSVNIKCDLYILDITFLFYIYTFYTVYRHLFKSFSGLQFHIAKIVKQMLLAH